ncbi:MAG: ATPase [Thermoproteota archaeon]|nr:MAG: ATPase [Candidatus Korarchaeota archaeon]
MAKYLVDRSVLERAKLRTAFERGVLESPAELVISSFMVEELEHQAKEGDFFAKAALSELESIPLLIEKKAVTRLSVIPVKLDAASLRKLADTTPDLIVLTADKIRSQVLKSLGVPHKYLPPEADLDEFFTLFKGGTLSIHLKEGVPPTAKVGRPGKIKLIALSEAPVPREWLLSIAHALLEKAGEDPDCMLEVSKRNAYVIQYGSYRIAIAFPPFSDGIEITAVKPIAKVTLEDYKLSSKLKKRLAEKSEGVLVAGPPGAGKTTFTSALADFYRDSGKVVKTLESPRDLQVGPEITQYGKINGSFKESCEVLLLVRPDVVCFDEMRSDDDFDVYRDMRLAGIGMIGVVHCGSPIEAIERFIGRVELGMIPHVVDTVIFIRDGAIEKVYDLSLVVKLPTGLRDKALARPVVLVRDFETGNVEYEIYSFAEEVIVMPVAKPATGVHYRVTLRRNSVVINLGGEHANAEVSFYARGRLIGSAIADENGRIVLARKSGLGKRVIQAYKQGVLEVLPES